MRIRQALNSLILDQREMDSGEVGHTDVVLSYGTLYLVKPFKAVVSLVSEALTNTVLSYFGC